MKRKTWPISFTIILTLVIVVSGLLYLYLVARSNNDRRIQTQKLWTTLNVYTEQLSKALTLPLWNYDLEQTGGILESIMKDRVVYGIEIQDAETGKTIQARVRGKDWNTIATDTLDKNEGFFSAERPVMYSNSPIANVKVYITPRFMEEELRHNRHFRVLATIILELTIIIGVFGLLYFLVVLPIRRLNQYAEAISAGKNAPPEVESQRYYGELHTLHSSITRMVSTLDQRFDELQKTESKFRNLFESSPISLWEEDITDIIKYFDKLRAKGVVDLEAYLDQKPDEVIKCFNYLRVNNVNKVSVKMLGATSKSELIDNLSMTFTEASLRVFRKGLVAIWNNQTPFESEGILKAFNGEEKNVIVRWSQIRENKGGNVMLFVSINDISTQKSTERKLLENEKRLRDQNEEYLALNEELVESYEKIRRINEELRKAKEKAEESDKLKTAFLCNMSHEIRTPMNGIIGFVDLLTKSELPEAQRKQFGEIINQSCEQLLRLVNDIIDISKIEAGVVEVTEKEMDVQIFLDELYNFYKPIAHQKKIEFALDNRLPAAERRILADRTKLYQVINNLLSNAMKFTQSGMVKLSCYALYGYIHFEVEDTGIGIPTELHDAIFDRFRQAEIGDSRSYGGTGLGLSIAKGFAELMGGRVDVKSTPGTGSVFTVSLPLKTAPKVPPTPEPAKPNRSNQSKRVLVVEDENTNYLYIRELLHHLDCELVHTKLGKEAIAICLNDENIDMVLMDIKLPDMSGYEAVRQIRRNGFDKPIIAQTAYALSGDRDRAIDAGCTDYLAKPIRRKDLVGMIDKYTQK